MLIYTKIVVADSKSEEGCTKVASELEELLILTRGTTNAQRFRDLVIQPTVVSFDLEIGPIYVFVDDPDQPHRVHIVNLALHQYGVSQVKWPSCSPNYNPIAHAVNYLQRQLYVQNYQPETF